jgi:hypothetical protein
MRQVSDGDVRSYVAWVPVLRAEEKHVRSATKVVSDPRATHFWDGNGVLLSVFSPVLSISEPAWDIYMIFDRDARWERGSPPPPDFWMHQLGSRAAGPPLDAAAFAARVDALLEDQ